MNKNVKIIVPVAVLSVLALGLGARNIYASDNVGPTSLIVKIAQKFHLNESDVRSVFEDDRQEHQAYMQTQFENRLSDAVKNGKITEAQKQLILAKHAEMQTAHNAEMGKMADLSFDERRAYMEKRHETMEEERTALEAWAKANGIDPTYIMFGEGRGSHGGFGGGRR